MASTIPKTLTSLYDETNVRLLNKKAVQMYIIRVIFMNIIWLYHTIPISMCTRYSFQHKLNHVIVTTSQGQCPLFSLGFVLLWLGIGRFYPYHITRLPQWSNCEDYGWVIHIDLIWIYDLIKRKYLMWGILYFQYLAPLLSGLHLEIPRAIRPICNKWWQILFIW